MGCAPKVRFATDAALEGAGFEPSVPGRLQAKTPRFGIVLRRLLSSCGSFHIDHRLSCHVSPLRTFGLLVFGRATCLVLSHSNGASPKAPGRCYHAKSEAKSRQDDCSL